MTVGATQLPVRHLTRLLQAGVKALADNPGEWDSILGNDLLPKELADAKEQWTERPPMVTVHYPHADTPLPLIMVLRMSNSQVQAFLGDGYDREEDGWDSHERRAGTWGVHMMGINPDAVEWGAAAILRMFEIAAPYFHSRNMTCSVADAQDMMLDSPHGNIKIFAQRIVVRLEWEAYWPRQGALWEAVNGPTLPPGQSVEVDTDIFVLGGGG